MLEVRAKLDGLGALVIEYFEAGDWRVLNRFKIPQPCYWEKYADKRAEDAKGKAPFNFHKVRS